MNWPFVRRSKYEDISLKFFNLYDENIKLEEEINRLNQEMASELNNHRDTHASLHQEKSSNVILDEENIRLKEELSETKEKFVKAEALFDYWQKKCLNTERYLAECIHDNKEAEDALKIAQECLEEKTVQLETYKRSSKYHFDKSQEAKAEISKARAYLRKIAKNL